MKEVNGWVCLAESAEQPEGAPYPWNIIFGPAANDESGDKYSNITTNGLRAFSTRQAADQAALALKKRTDLRRIRLRYLRLRIAENETDLLEFKRSQQLIVIGETYGGHCFWGRHVEGAPHIGYIPGALLCGNGLRGTRYEQATYIHQEVRRQGHTAASIADFRLSTVP